jgi:peptidoglycan hydrolase-like protein with peptidoglycan-binding domain
MPQTGAVDEPLLEHIRYTRKVAQASEMTASTEVVGTKTDKQAEASIEAKMMRLQKLLVTLGYDAGKADGKMSAATRKAIKQFEADNDMPQTGNFSEGLLKQVVAARSSAANDQ